MSSITTLEKFRQFRASGPVSESYMADVTHRVQVIRGPVGSGKTVSSVFKSLDLASRLMPVCKDGAIHCKLAVAGVTYGQLERNLYPTWHYWLPKDGGDWTEGEWEGGRGRFAEQKIAFDVLRKGRIVPVYFHAIFAAIGELSVESFVRGFEPSMWYLYEVDQFPDGIIEQALGRLGRFPNADMLPEGASWRGLVFGDTNAGETDHWYHKTFEEMRPAGWRQYVQPAGDSPQAENIQNLPRGYYDDLKSLNAHKPKWVRRFIKNRYGPSGEGDPVYDETFDEQMHVAPEDLRATRGRGVMLAFDQGLRPAAVILQRQASGQLRVLGEVFRERMSVRRFAQAVRDELSIVAPGEKVTDAWGDPAGFTGVDDQDSGDMAWMDLLSAELVPDVLETPILPCDTNTPDICITAVEDELTHMVAAGIPGILVSPRCTWLKKGFASEYKFEKRPETKDQVKRPIKNLFANVHNALQYGIVGEKGRHGVITGFRDRTAPERATRAMREQDGAARNVHELKAPMDLG